MEMMGSRKQTGNYDETLNVSPLQERNMALTWVQLVKVYCGKLLLKLTVMTLYKHAVLSLSCHILEVIML